MLRRMSDLLNPEDGVTGPAAEGAGATPAEGMKLEDLDPELRKAIEDMQKGMTPPEGGEGDQSASDDAEPPLPESTSEPVQEPGSQPATSGSDEDGR